MKMRRIICFVLFATLLSCGSEDDCSGNLQDVLCLDDFGCPNAAFLVSIESQQEFQLIRNQEDFDIMVFTSCDVQIDWEVYDLVIGAIGLSSGLMNIEKSIRTNCLLNQNLLDIVINTNITASADRITWQAVIPKLADDESLFVDITVE